MVPNTLRGWTYVRADGSLVTQTAVPFERLQVRSLDDVVSMLNRFVDRVISATLGSRSVPFGAGGTVYPSVAFSGGQILVLAHHMGTANLSAFWGACASGSVANAIVAFDASNVTITGPASFAAPLFILANA